MRTLTVLLFGMLFVLGCAGTTPGEKSVVVTKQYFKADKETTLNTVRFFCTREDFRVIRFEAENGKVLASRNDRTDRAEDFRTITLSANVAPSDSATTSVEVKFGFANYMGTVTRADEDLLADYYHRFFAFLEDNL